MPSRFSLDLNVPRQDRKIIPSEPHQSVLTSEFQVVTFGFDSFQTYIGPTAAQADKSKACAIHLNLQYPGGFQYAIVDATYHGYARLDAGVTGNFLSTYFFSQAASNTVLNPLPLKLKSR